MRIIFDARCVFRGKGGIGRYARGLLEALAWREPPHEFVVILSGVSPLDSLSLPDQFELFAAPTGMIDETWEQLHLPTALDHWGADLYFNPTFATPLLADCLRVSTIHDVVFERHPELVEPGLRAYLSRASRLTAEHADLVLTVSEFSKGEICEVYGLDPSRVRVVYNGVDARFHSAEVAPKRAEELRGELRLPPDTPFLLYVGAVEPKKNIENLLRAFARARERIPHMLVLAGGQGGMPWRPEDVIRELDLMESVRLVGYVPDELVAELMNLADGFLYPSLYEGFGLPPLEAMACGTPTLVSNASSLPEVVGDGALKVDPRDVDEMAEGIKRLATDEELRSELTRSGRERAGEFTWERAAQGVLSVFEELASQDARGTASDQGANTSSGTDQ